ncbi:uncharacterized protein N7496_004289 [Penicillium cataractarum]|uniref:Uncharacterized protein n=1 Tax=Penicillium cataractarum TaxID=2100454 RepID=A0A9W9SNU7_9EURO|nr:uncharacterized protein N7496_004289 [Penicillium cataractarum]KAJ5381861.1 hypothetical protein N7496_004289 [Penicillium cataractarum]
MVATGKELENGSLKGSLQIEATGEEQKQVQSHAGPHAFSRVIPKGACKEAPHPLGLHERLHHSTSSDLLAALAAHY